MTDKEDIGIEQSQKRAICPFYMECEFFQKKIVENSAEMALKLDYCFTENAWCDCARWQYYYLTGKNPPASLLPSGGDAPKGESE